MQPVRDPVASVVLQATLADIDSVMVSDRWRRRHGRLVDVELSPKLDAPRSFRERIVQAMRIAA